MQKRKFGLVRVSHVARQAQTGSTRDGFDSFPKSQGEKLTRDTESQLGALILISTFTVAWEAFGTFKPLDVSVLLGPLTNPLNTGVSSPTATKFKGFAFNLDDQTLQHSVRKHWKDLLDGRSSGYRVN